MSIPFQEGDVLFAADLNQLALKPEIQSAIPTSGSTVVVNESTTHLIVNPATNLASLTISLPSSPTNGQQLSVVSTKTITSLTITSNKIIPTSISLPFTFMYINTISTWVRL